MSTNCLVTKLKGIVNNPSLEKLGVINVEFVEGGAVLFSEEQEVTLLNGTFKSTGNNKITISANTMFYFTTNTCILNTGETIYNVEVPKYHLCGARGIASNIVDLNKLYKWSDAPYVELYFLSGTHTIKGINDYTGKFGGQLVTTSGQFVPTEKWNVNNLGINGRLTRLYISHFANGWMEGNFDNLGCSPLTEIVFPGGLAENCSFNIESFVRNNVANGRATYSISNFAHPGAVNAMFKENLLTSDVNKNYSISWTPSATAGSTDIVLTDKSTGTSQTETITNVG